MAVCYIKLHGPCSVAVQLLSGPAKEFFLLLESKNICPLRQGAPAQAGQQAWINDTNPLTSSNCNLFCFVTTLLGRRRGHWLTKPAENEDAAWQQERSPEIPQNLCLPVRRGKQSSIVDSSLLARQANDEGVCHDHGWPNTVTAVGTGRRVGGDDRHRPYSAVQIYLYEVL